MLQLQSGVASLVWLKCPLFSSFLGAGGCRLRSEDVLTTGWVQRETSLWEQTKCIKSFRSQPAEVSFINYFPPSLPLHTPASHSFAIIWPCHQAVMWSGQDCSLDLFPHIYQAVEPGRAASCFWPLLCAPCLGGSLLQVLVAVLFPMLCLRTLLPYWWLCCKNCEERYGAVKSWRRVVMNAKVLKKSNRANSSLTVTVW